MISMADAKKLCDAGKYLKKKEGVAVVEKK
jgi:hypothetical protein